jgi:hypothetical protein
MEAIAHIGSRIACNAVPYGYIKKVVMWNRSCPHCKGELRKQHILEVARCIRGWIWG